jgi:predicted N-acetyltransferase YhbS
VGRGLGVRVRPLEERDAAAAAAIACEVDDARVLSPAGRLHRMRSQPERARALELVAEVDGEVVAVGSSALDTSTTTVGACWATISVTGAYRRRGIGSTLVERLLDHLRRIGGTRATSFVRWSEEGERWALARGWQRVLTGR